MNRLIALFADAADAAIVVDQEQRIVHANDAARKLFALRPGEEFGEPLTEFCPLGVGASDAHPDGSLVPCRARDGREFEARAVRLNVHSGEEPLSVCIVWPLGGGENAAHTSDVYQRALLKLARTREVSSGDFEAAAKAICLIVSDTMQVERVSVWLLSDDGECLECVSLFERGSRSFGSGMRLVARDYPTYFGALEEGRAIAAHDASHDPRTAELAPGYLEVLGIGAMLDAVLRVEGEIVGVVCHEHVGQPRTWREEEIVFAGEVADLAVQALLTSKRFRAEQEREGLEEELRQSQKLEALGRLAAGVAHDFNNLLAVILGNAEIARGAGTGPETDEALEEITDAAERAAELTRRLLAVGRKQVLAKEDVDWNDRVRASLKLLRRLIPEHIHLEVRTGATPAWVHADPHQLDQVLMNLCLNARDALEDGGTITISTAIEAGPRGGRDEAVLRVSDDGEGIPEADLERIFEPFYTSKEGLGGTGLGLSMIYGIVRQHGGVVRVDSEPGRGATFEVRLPAGSPPARKESRVMPHAEDSGGETVLLAEDSAPLRRMTRRLLERAGYRVVESPNGRDALELFEEDHDAYDLALLDVVMPEMDGRATFEALRSSGSQLPVLFMTGYGASVLSPDFLRREDVAVLNKPFEAPELLRAVRAALDRGVSAAD